MSKISEFKKRQNLLNSEPWYCTKEVNDCVKDIPIKDIMQKKCHKYYTKKNSKINVCRNNRFPEITRACIDSAWSSNKILKNMCKEKVENMTLHKRRSSGRRSSGRRSSGKKNIVRRSSSIKRSEIRKANTRRSSSTRRFEDLMKQNEEAFNRMNNR